jgi:hypothetical protein
MIPADMGYELTSAATFLPISAFFLSVFVAFHTICNLTQMYSNGRFKYFSATSSGMALRP